MIFGIWPGGCSELLDGNVQEEFAEGKVPVLEVIMENDSTYGLALSEFDKGVRLRIAARVGGATEDYLLPAPAAQCAATLTFRIGRGK